MSWEAQAKTLAELIQRILNDNLSKIKNNAADNPSSAYEIPEPELSEIRKQVNESTESIRESAASTFDNPETDGAVFLDTKAKSVAGFYAIKSLKDSVNRIHSTSIARQIFPEEEREHAVNSAVESSLSKILNTAESEASASYALYHRQIAIDTGFEYFIYQTSEDEVVRPEHSRRNGKVFIYGAERVADDVPGLANHCRCTALPVTLQEIIEGGYTFFYTEDAPNVANKKPQISYKINNKVDVVGDIDWWEDNDFLSVKQRIDSDLNGDTETDLEIDISSHGGDGYAGLAAYSYLKSIPNRVVVNVYGHAGSAATAFIAGADHVIADEADQILVHSAWTYAVGDKEELRKAADGLETFDNSLIMAYQYKTGRTEEEIKSLMAKNQYISAKEALEFGLIDEIRGNASTPLAQADILTNGGQMTDTKSIEELEQKVQKLESENETLQAKADGLETKNGTLTAENAALAKQVQEKPDVKALVEEELAAKAQAEKDLNAEKDRLEGLGVEAKGDTPEELRASAVKALGLDQDGWTDAQNQAALSVMDKNSDDGELGKRLLAHGDDKKKPETRAEQRKRLQGGK